MTTENLIPMKLVLSFLLFISLPTVLPGQLSLGLDGGLAFTSLRGTDRVEDFRPALGWQAGLKVTYRFPSSDIGLSSGLYRDFRASQTELPLTDENGQPNGLVNAHTNWNYLTIPLELCIYEEGKVTTVYALGLYTAFLQRQWFSEETPLGAEETIENTFNSTPIDFGFTARIAWQVPLSDRISLSAGLRAFFGLNNASSAPLVDEGKIKHFGLGVLTGFHYGF